MGFLEFEDKVKKWIEENRVWWCVILFFMGVSLIFLSIGNLNGGILMGYLLVLIEIAVGGSGVDNS